MEHGVRGDLYAGDGKLSDVDAKTGIKIVNLYEYPLRHGMTIGELALMYNDVKNVGAKVTVLKMQGWKRDMWYDETGLVWVPGSPNMPDMDTPLFFSAVFLLT